MEDREGVAEVGGFLTPTSDLQEGPWWRLGFFHSCGLSSVRADAVGWCFSAGPRGPSGDLHGTAAQELVPSGGFEGRGLGARFRTF